MKKGQKAYQSPPGSHRHKCRKCGRVWEHPDSCKGDDAAHVCAGCGQERFIRYDGILPPTEAKT
jgi:hypothetical protein